jgi:hypothetical protein
MYVFIFESGSAGVVQAGLEFVILPQSFRWQEIQE